VLLLHLMVPVRLERLPEPAPLLWTHLSVR